MPDNTPLLFHFYLGVSLTRSLLRLSAHLFAHSGRYVRFKSSFNGARCARAHASAGFPLPSLTQLRSGEQNHRTGNHKVYQCQWN